MREADAETLAALVLAKAKKCGGRGEEIDSLLQDVESLVLGSPNGPVTLSLIGIKIRSGAKSWPEVKALADAMILNGDRRRLMDAPLLERIEERISGLEKSIPMLSGWARDRVESLLAYHAGVFYGVIGDFEKAVEYQEKSVLIAKKMGDKEKEAIGWFMKFAYELREAVFLGYQGNQLVIYFADVEEQLDCLAGVQWAEGNGPTFMILASIWLDWPNWATYVEKVLQAAEKLGSSWDSTAEFVRAAESGSKEALESYIHKKDAPERIATAYLILIRLAIEANDQKGAKELLDRMPKDPSAKHVFAIAERLLK